MLSCVLCVVVRRFAEDTEASAEFCLYIPKKKQKIVCVNKRYCALAAVELIIYITRTTKVGAILLRNKFFEIRLFYKHLF